LFHVFVVLTVKYLCILTRCFLMECYSVVFQRFVIGCFFICLKYLPSERIIVKVALVLFSFRRLLQLRRYKRKSVEVGVFHKGWVTMRLNFRLKGYVSRQCLWTVRYGNGHTTTLPLEGFTQRYPGSHKSLSSLYQ